MTASSRYSKLYDVSLYFFFAVEVLRSLHPWDSGVFSFAPPVATKSWSVISIMTSERKPLNVLHDYQGKELEQPGKQSSCSQYYGKLCFNSEIQLDKQSSPSMSLHDDVPPPDGIPAWLLDSPPDPIPPWLLDFDPAYPGNTIPGNALPEIILPGSIPPRKTLQDSLLNQHAQPTANPRPRLQFHGSSIRDRPGYVSPPRVRPAPAEHDTSERPRRWHPSDDDLIIYGRKIAPETEDSTDDDEIAGGEYPHSYMQRVSGGRPQNTDRQDVPRGPNRESHLGPNYSSGGEGNVVMESQSHHGLQPALSQQTSSTTGSVSMLTTFPSPRTKQELQTLQIMSEVNPQGFENVTRHLDSARDPPIQHVSKMVVLHCLF